MQLKITKKLTLKEAERIKNLIQKVNFLKELSDSALFKEDFSSLDKRTKNLSAVKKEIISEHIAAGIPQSLYQLQASAQNYVYGHTAPVSTNEKLLFSIFSSTGLGSGTKASDAVAIGISSVNISKENVFLSSFSCYLMPDSKYFQNINRFGKIFLTALFFYNKRDIYIDIKNILDKNKQKITGYLGEAFIEDLALLFSVKKGNKEVPAYLFASSSKEELFSYPNVPEYYLLSKNDLGFSKLEYFYGQASFVTLEGRLRLEGNNALSLYLEIISNHSGPGQKFDQLTNLKNLRNNPEFSKFIDEKISDWLKNLDSMTSFGFNIYNKLKTKILICNT